MTVALLVLAMQLFEVSADKVVWVGRFPELGGSQYLLDFVTGRFVPAEDAELVQLMEAKQIVTRTELVSFRSQEAILAGKLTLPAAAGHYPAVVLIHGSNDQDRDSLDPWVGFFVSRGLAVLSYDKRGVRESTGDWKHADFRDLADDTLAGVQLLRARKDIDPRRVGLFAISQGGWIAPLVASRNRDIAFIILHAGPAIRVADNNLRFIEAELRGYGFPDQEIARAMAYHRMNDEVTRDPSRWGELKALYDAAMARNVEWLLEEPQPIDSWFRRFYRGVMDFDPGPVWAEVGCPVLAFFGELDHNVPPEANRHALEAVLRRRSADDSTVIVLPKANHLFLRAERGTRDEYGELDSFVAGYFDVMATWLAERLRAS